MTSTTETRTWTLSMEAEITVSIWPYRKVWRGFIRRRLVYEVPIAVTIGGHDVIRESVRGASLEEAMQKLEGVGDLASKRIARAWKAAEAALLRELKGMAK